MLQNQRPRRGPIPFAVFNLVGDVAKARADWKARFENRKPPTKPRAAKTVKVKAAATDTTDILLYDEIGYWGVTAKEFVTALATITTPNIRVRINSPGGDVFDGMTIFNALQGWKGDVACVVEGLAASAASFIAMAGDTVAIHESAMMMIHRAWGFAMGNTVVMTDMADVLAKIDGQIADIYAKQSGKTADEMLKLMDGTSDGTWFTAEEAKAAGLVGAVITADSEDPQNPIADDDAMDPCCDPDSPDYDPEDPDCMCSEQAKAAARAAVAEKQLVKRMRMRLALADAD